jgi:hypothetical protein
MAVVAVAVAVVAVEVAVAPEIAQGFSLGSLSRKRKRGLQPLGYVFLPGLSIMVEHFNYL